MSDQTKQTPADITNARLPQLYDAETARQNLSSAAQFYERMGDTVHLGVMLQLLDDIEREISDYRREIYTDLVTQPQT